MIAAGTWPHEESACQRCPDCRWRFLSERAFAKHRRQQHGGHV